MLKRITIQRAGLTLDGQLSIPNNVETFNLAILMYGFSGPKKPKNANTLIPDLADKLLSKNIATITFDFAGHNNSTGNIENMTIFNELEDANAVLQYALHLKGVNYIYLIGHSQGGVISSMLAGYYPEKISKVVLLAPAATLVDDAKLGVCQGNTYDPNNMPEKIKFNNWSLNSFYFRTARYLNIFEVAKNFHKPVLALHGSEDKIVNNYASRHYQAIYDNCEFHLIPNSDHGLHIGRDQVFTYVCDFLEK